MNSSKDTSEMRAAICGLDCGICSWYPDQCGGCLSDRVNSYCRECPEGFRACARKHNVTRCYECSDYPCKRIADFCNDGTYLHYTVMDNIDRIREIGFEKWVQEQP